MAEERWEARGTAGTHLARVDLLTAEGIVVGTHVGGVGAIPVLLVLGLSSVVNIGVQRSPAVCARAARALALRHPVAGALDPSDQTLAGLLHPSCVTLSIPTATVLATLQPQTSQINAQNIASVYYWLSTRFVGNWSVNLHWKPQQVLRITNVWIDLKNTALISYLFWSVSSCHQCDAHAKAIKVPGNIVRAFASDTASMWAAGDLAPRM